MSSNYHFRLYVNGIETVAADTKKLCTIITDHVGEEIQLDVFDVIDNLSQAEQDGVIVTPTLLMLSPAPGLKVIGRFNDTEKIIEMLKMAAKSQEE